MSSFRHASAHLGVRSRRAGGHCQPGSDSHRWQAIYPILGTVAALLTIAGLGWISHVRIVPTDSAGPAGIYRLQKIGEPVAMTWDEPGRPIIAGPHRSDLVLACLPMPIAAWAMQRHYLAGGSCPGGAEPVVKILAAVQGDVLVIYRGFVTINNVRFPQSQTSEVDSQGRALPHVPWGPRQVAAGEVWLLGFNNPRSWDARYFGPIPADNVAGVLQPLVTW